MKRFHKYRIDQATRDKYAETDLSPHDFICPYFIVEGEKIKKKIKNFDGVYHFSIDQALKDIPGLLKIGINKILLFGVIAEKQKDEVGSFAYYKDNLVSRAIKEIKKKFPKLTVISDICLCGYTSHGHCGMPFDSAQGTRLPWASSGVETLSRAGARSQGQGLIDNDSTLQLLAKMAVKHAQAGADIVAPSAMMDGQVAAIRKALDSQGFKKVKILAYSAKYASSFYGPFREAAKSSPSFGDRKTYQIDYRNAKQALKEIEADIKEGADMIMVKPAHTYLDIIAQAKQKYPNKILTAYHVSGEYMLIRAAAKQGRLDEKQAFQEVLTSIKRAGADWIISYYAKKLF